MPKVWAANAALAGQGRISRVQQANVRVPTVRPHRDGMGANALATGGSQTVSVKVLCTSKIMQP